MKKDTDSAGGSPQSREPLGESVASFKSGAKTKVKTKVTTKAKAPMTATMKRRALKPKKSNASPRRKGEDSSQG